MTVTTFAYGGLNRCYSDKVGAGRLCLWEQFTLAKQSAELAGYKPWGMAVLMAVYTRLAVASTDIFVSQSGHCLFPWCSFPLNALALRGRDRKRPKERRSSKEWRFIVPALGRGPWPHNPWPHQLKLGKRLATVVSDLLPSSHHRIVGAHFFSP